MVAVFRLVHRDCPISRLSYGMTSGSFHVHINETPRCDFFKISLVWSSWCTGVPEVLPKRGVATRSVHRYAIRAQAVHVLQAPPPRPKIKFGFDWFCEYIMPAVFFKLMWRTQCHKPSPKSCLGCLWFLWTIPSYGRFMAARVSHIMMRSDVATSPTVGHVPVRKLLNIYRVP